MTTPKRADAGGGEPSPSGTVEAVTAEGHRPALTPRAGTPDAPGEVVDVSVLLSLETAQAEGAPDIIVELIDLYVEDAPRRLAAVRRALEEADAPAARRAAHALRGSSASLGAHRVAALCDEIERLPGEGPAQKGASLLTRLTHEFACVRRAFADERSRRLLPGVSQKTSDHPIY